MCQESKAWFKKKEFVMLSIARDLFPINQRKFVMGAILAGKQVSFDEWYWFSQSSWKFESVLLSVAKSQGWAFCVAAYHYHKPL